VGKWFPSRPRRGPRSPQNQFAAPSLRLIPKGENRVPLPGWRGVYKVRTEGGAMQSTNSAEQTRKRRGWPKSANWDLWEKGKRFTIRELIWLSLGFDAPAPYDDDNRRQLAAEIRRTFKERFELTRRLLVVEDSPHYFVKPNDVVELSVFRNIAEELGWVLPERFPKPPTSELEASPRSPDRPIGERERTALLNIIGGLLGLLLDKAPSGKK